LSKKSAFTKLKVLIKLFQKFAESKGRAFGRRPQTAKYSIGGAFTRAVAIFRAIVHCFLPFKQCCELKNSPVGCFSRGDALQEKASPYFGCTFVCLPI